MRAGGVNARTSIPPGEACDCQGDKTLLTTFPGYKGLSSFSPPNTPFNFGSIHNNTLWVKGSKRGVGSLEKALTHRIVPWDTHLSIGIIPPRHPIPEAEIISNSS